MKAEPTEVKAEFRGVAGQLLTARFSITELGDARAMAQARAWIRRQADDEIRCNPHVALVARSLQRSRLVRR